MPDHFEISDFLPDEDRMLVPAGEVAAVPDNDVLHFVLIKRKTSSLSSPWSIPDRGEFDDLVNDATQAALLCDCLAPFAWADPKRGNIVLYANSRTTLEHFCDVISSISSKDPHYEY